MVANPISVGYIGIMETTNDLLPVPGLPAATEELSKAGKRLTKFGQWVHRGDLTEADHARELGVPQSTVSRCCTGEQIPRRSWMRRLQELTGAAVSFTDWPDEPDRRWRKPGASA